MAATEGLEVLMCVTEIRFYSGGERKDIEFSPKMIRIDPAGTFLSTINVPVGNYDQIELRLHKDCSGLSASVKNHFGQFNVADRMDINFRGNLTINGNLSRLVLDMGQILHGLAQARNRNEVVRVLEEEEGGCGGD